MKLENYFDIALELGIPNEFILPIKQIEDILFFQTKNGTKYSAKVTKAGKLKKNSIRIDL